MTLRVLGAAMVLTAMTASLAHADSEIPEGVLLAADKAGVDPVDLLAASNATGLTPEHYLCVADGLLCPPAPPAPVSSPLVECIISHESRGNPYAVNPTTKASGLGQFLASTWRTTPQGKAGMSVFDPAANRAAIAWMLSVGRGREFVGIRGC